MKLLIALICALAGLAVAMLVTPYQGFKSETYVDIPHGTSTAGIASELARDGVIRYEWEFWLARLLKPSSKLQAGEYRFAKPDSALDVFNQASPESKNAKIDLSQTYANEFVEQTQRMR